MAKKRLAETLVEEGTITEVQLQKALQRQLLMGGKIGTNLIELKFISEKQLDAVLSRIYRIPSAPHESLVEVPPDVITSIPKEIAVRHRIVPISKEHKTITVAMENPNDIGIIDELSFMTGCRIATVVASEVRIALWLEKYYGQPRDLRYIEIMRPKDDEFVIERSLTHTEYVGTPVREAKKEERAPDSSEWLSGNEGESLYEVDYRKAAAKVLPAAEAASTSKPLTIQETVQKLTSIETRDEAIGAALDYISQYVDDVIFFVVSPAEAKAWDAKCKGVEPSKASDIKINFGGPSVFLTVKNSEQPYYGEITGFPFDEDFLDKIGRKRPLRVFLAPVMVKKKMVSILYIDNGNKEIPPEKIADINSVIGKLSIAFEILLLRKKSEAKK